MPWAKLDDEILDNPKVARVGPLGFALHIAAITWASRNMTDGYLPASKVRLLLDLGDVFERSSGEHPPKFEPCDGQKVAERLVLAGLWEPTEGGFRIHDFLKYNPSKAQVLEERAKARDRMARLRNTDEGSSEDVRANFGRSSRGPVTRNPLPVTHSPTPSQKNSSSRTQESERADVTELCELMVTLNRERNAQPQTITQGWRREARLLLDRDGRPLPEALALLEWAAHDQFWAANILSLPKFRAQYDQLRIQRERPANGKSARAARDDIPSRDELREMTLRLEAEQAAKEQA